MFCDFVCDMVFSQSSPSLVALEVDSEEDMAETNVLPPPRSSDVEKRAEKVKVASRQLPDLTCTRSKSASSAFDPATKVHNKGRRPRNSFSKALISLWTKFFFSCSGLGRPGSSTAFLFLLFPENQFPSHTFRMGQSDVGHEPRSVTLLDTRPCPFFVHITTGVSHKIYFIIFYVLCDFTTASNWWM